MVLLHPVTKKHSETGLEVTDQNLEKVMDLIALQQREDFCLSFNIYFLKFTIIMCKYYLRKNYKYFAGRDSKMSIIFIIICLCQWSIFCLGLYIMTALQRLRTISLCIVLIFEIVNAIHSYSKAFEYALFLIEHVYC